MITSISSLNILTRCVLIFTISITAALAALAAQATPDATFVTYEDFGAVGDGITDDLPAISKAHQHANEKGLPVRTKPGATYHLGRKAITAIIATNTDWGTSKFIIDDSKGVENNRKSLFEVRSLLKPISLKIDRLSKGQKQLGLRPTSDCLVYVENKKRKLYIRRGLNQNSGSPQQEVFILHRNGSITGTIEWDYDVITSIKAQPIDPEQLVIRGGLFTNIANQHQEGQDYSYWARNIKIWRSNTLIDGVQHRVTGEKEQGLPYNGFLSVSQCANVTLQNCKISARKVYKKIGNANKPVPMGTYGYSASNTVNLKMLKCHMDDIHDRSRWGVMGTNNMKNFLVEDCVLSRVDVHKGVSGFYIIRNSTIGHGGINAIGSGKLIVENTTLHSSRLISFRQDYGSTWDGAVLIKNCRWMKPGKNATMFVLNNDGTHDFGYPCSMPSLIRIDGLKVKDGKPSKNNRAIQFFGNSLASSLGKKPFPYQLTQRIEIQNIETTSGTPPIVSRNPEINKLITVVPATAVQPLDKAGKKK